MLEVTAAQLDTFIATFIFPAARILGLMAATPLFNNRMIPMRVRLIIGLVITVAVIPMLPPLPVVSMQSWYALLIMAQQMLIGIAAGFLVRLFFAAVDIAGEMIGLQMGLSFAVFFSPQTGGQSSVIAEFLGLFTLLLFVAMDGHLMVIQIISASFEWLPIGQSPASSAWIFIVRHASVMFAFGVLLALPLITTLLITNIALGVLTRSAPQLNLFAVGFPVTLSIGFIMVFLCLNLFAPIIFTIFERSFLAVDELLRVMH